MSKFKKKNRLMPKIKLIAKSIIFKKHSIVYVVDVSKIKGNGGIVVNSKTIENKDLILKTNYLDKGSCEVSFTPAIVTCQFYQAIYEGTIRNQDEYLIQKNEIYKVGDVVGYIII